MKIKKLNAKGFGHVEAILGVFVVIALVAIGGFVYQRSQNSSNTTVSAGSWEPIVEKQLISDHGSSAHPETADISVFGCRQEKNGKETVKGLFVLTADPAHANYFGNPSDYYVGLYATKDDTVGGKIIATSGAPVHTWWANQLATAQLTYPSSKGINNIILSAAVNDKRQLSSGLHQGFSVRALPECSK